ncbi:IclR family transcriptional regulator [Phytoactinopolyspora halotolerans]|uniref:Glycerol operon regulatory protein n=1 Tax=Phytoactinopolyspora halotolerans TaxID=1981512 RepID=A0A6L9SJ64_9ACTN|nr:IclR family transcriptional regulator [Phytoactinopolyspora halotolerans]NEE04714.1 IclR family transcriptional regulator [Phytoactinopolyspora halotolerans]
MAEETPRFAAPAVVRCLRVLELLADSGGSMSLTEVADALDLPKSSVHHILTALNEFGWVERDPDTLRVTLGLRAWEVGQAYDLAQSLSQRARTYMDQVRDKLSETVRLAVRSGSDQVCIAKTQGPHKLVFDQRVGARLPCHATGLGKALLTGLDDTEIDALYPAGLERFTENTVADLPALKAELATAREAGYAEDYGEYILGIRCVAVPVRSRGDQVVAALSVSGPTRQFTDAHVHESIEALRAAAASLGLRLGDETELT